MSAKQNSYAPTMMEQSRKKRRELPPWIKGLGSALIVLPCILLFFYATGAWQVQIEGGKAVLDDWDSIFTSFSIFSGFGALAIFHFSCKYYETE